jgi:hypothetical protein
MYILNEIKLSRQHRDKLVRGHEHLTRQLQTKRPKRRFRRTR